MDNIFIQSTSVSGSIIVDEWRFRDDDLTNFPMPVVVGQVLIRSNERLLMPHLQGETLTMPTITQERLIT